MFLLQKLLIAQLVLDKVVLEKVDCNKTVPQISKQIEVMSQVQLKYTIVKYPNILKKSFFNRVKKNWNYSRTFCFWIFLK